MFKGSRSVAVVLFLIFVAGGAAAQEGAARKAGEIEPKYLADFKERVLDFCEEVAGARPEAQAYVIGYDGAGRRLGGTKFSLRAVRQYVSLACRLPDERVVTIRGGLRRVPTLEFWVVPEGAPPPEPTPPPAPRKRARGIKGAGEPSRHMDFSHSRLTSACNRRRARRPDRPRVTPPMKGAAHV